MPLQNKYRGIPEPNFASFDWYDLATGTGYKDFFGIDMREGADAVVYALTINEYFGHKGFTTFSATAGEINFDLDLEVPLTIDGIVIINAPIGSSSNIGSPLCTFKIYRVDSASVEHQLGSTVTATPATAINGSSEILSVRFDVDVTRLKKGEKFRLSCASPNVDSFNWAHEPTNFDRSFHGGADLISSQLKISLPIKI